MENMVSLKKYKWFQNGWKVGRVGLQAYQLSISPEHRAWVGRRCVCKNKLGLAHKGF